MKKSTGRSKGLRPCCLGLILLAVLGTGCGESHNSDAVAGVEDLSSPQTLNQEVEDDFKAEDDSSILARAVGGFSGQIALASSSSSGVSANSNSYGASLSADGRYLAFVSNATNLTSQPTYSQYQVYRKDLETGEVVCVSSPYAGGEGGNNRSFQPHISDDGSRIAFTSRATNIGPFTNPANIDQAFLALFFPSDPFNPHVDFRLELLSKTYNWGNQGASGHSQVRDFAGNNWIAFRSMATDLNWDDQDTRWDMYRTEIQDNTGYYYSGNPSFYTSLESVLNNPNTKGNGNTTSPALTQDGQTLLMTTTSSNLVPAGTVRPALVKRENWNNTQHVALGSGLKVYDVEVAEQAPTEMAVSVRNQANTAFEVYLKTDHGFSTPGPTEKKLSNECRQEDGFAISDDGRFVVFEDRDKAEFSDTDGRFDIYLYDSQENKFYWVSKDSPNTSHAYRPTISDDGSTIAWDQGGKIWTIGNPALGMIVPETPQLVSSSTTGVQSNGGWQGVEGPTISDNGRYLTFASKATNLVSGATNGKYYLYRKDLSTGELLLVSRRNGTNAVAEADWVSYLSDDGSKVVFSSKLADLGETAVPSSNYANVYARDIVNGTTKLLMSKARILDVSPDWSPELTHVVCRSYGSQNEHPQGVAPGFFEGIIEYWNAGPLYIPIPSHISQSYTLQTAKYSKDRRYLFASFSNPSDPSRFFLYRFSGWSYYGNNEMLITDQLYYSDFDCSEDGETVVYVEKEPGVTYSKHVRIRKLTGWGSWDEPLPTQCSNVNISLDGRYVLFYDSNMPQGANTGSGSNAYVYDTQTHTNLPLRTERVSFPGTLRMSGDGRSIIFSDAPNSNTQLYVVKNPHL